MKYYVNYFKITKAVVFFRQCSGDSDVNVNISSSSQETVDENDMQCDIWTKLGHHVSYLIAAWPKC